MKTSRLERTHNHVPPHQPYAIARRAQAIGLGRHVICCGNPFLLTTILNGRQAKACIADPAASFRISGWGYSESSKSRGPLPNHFFFGMGGASLQLMQSDGAPAGLTFIFADWPHVCELAEAGQLLKTPLVDMAIWTKSASQAADGLYRHAHELCCVFQTRAGSKGAKLQLPKNRLSRTNIWTYPDLSPLDGPGRDLFAPKPVPMMTDILLDCTKPGDIVIDPFLGVGSTLVAAETTGRICVGADEDPRSVDAVVRRWQALTGQDAIELSTGQPFDALVPHLLGGDHDA